MNLTSGPLQRLYNGTLFLECRSLWPGNAATFSCPTRCMLAFTTIMVRESRVEDGVVAGPNHEMEWMSGISFRPSLVDEYVDPARRGHPAVRQPRQ